MINQTHWLTSSMHIAQLKACVTEPKAYISKQFHITTSEFHLTSQIFSSYLVTRFPLKWSHINAVLCNGPVVKW